MSICDVICSVLVRCVYVCVHCYLSVCLSLLCVHLYKRYMCGVGVLMLCMYDDLLMQCIWGVEFLDAFFVEL